MIVAIRHGSLLACLIIAHLVLLTITLLIMFFNLFQSVRTVGSSHIALLVRLRGRVVKGVGHLDHV